MEVNRSNNQRGLRSRREILEVATRVMSERGYGATSMSTLSKESGLPKSSIYHHFASKGELLSAVMEDGAKSFFGHMREAQAEPPADLSPKELLGWFLQQTGEIFLVQPEFLRLHLLLLMSAEADDTQVGAIIERVRREGRLHMRWMISTSFAAHGAEVAQAVGEALEYFAIAGFDGAFVAWQAEPDRSIRDQMSQLTIALAALADAVIAERESGTAEMHPEAPL